MTPCGLCRRVVHYPELGYYSSPETTIGREGDFYTSPHLHPIFGAMIGKTLMEMWDVMGKPDNFNAVEMGAGVGYLSKDIFDYLYKSSSDSSLSQNNSDFLRSLKYVIVEPYEHFQKRQRELLAGRELKGNNSIKWVKSLDELQQGVNGCIFSNELLDAFPVHLVEINDELKEVHISFNGRELVEEKNRISSEEIADCVKQFSLNLPNGYRTEINLRIKNWLRNVTEVLSRGFLLTIDYGYSAREYYSEDRTKGTLLCYHKHLFNENPYQNIGQQDITAHVNFSSLKKWGEEIGLKTTGYCSQGTFLTASGIDEVITELYSDSPDYLFEISKIKGLIMPQGMGESHSVMIQYKGEGLPELRGFSMRNQAVIL
ncbi:MAG TPA: class I SAM-dependent methyltransferase [Nitrospirae bacterium]|nr:class I SAM-dependent methyltransferase [Nitrospirota bacterium]HDZ02920.1 class I SAM-dependent methyltransferase [Nitrospirota bacterium]